MACRLFGTKPLHKPMLTYYQLISWEQTFSNQNTKLFIKKWICRLRNCGRFNKISDGDDMMKTMMMRRRWWWWRRRPVFYLLLNIALSNERRHYICYAFSHRLWPCSTNNHMHSKVWDETNYPFRNFNGCTVEGWQWISNFTPHIILDAITYPCRD